MQAVPAATAIGFLRARMLLQATDVLEPTGYPDLPSGRIRLVRLGQVVATALVGLAGGDNLVIVAQEHCTGLNAWRN